MATKDYNKLAHEYGVNPKAAEALDKRFAALESNRNTGAQGQPATTTTSKTQSF